jgi:hypothetical protein
LAVIGFADVGQQSSADMEALRPGKEIVMSFEGLETQLSIVGDVVLMEGAAIAEDIETGTKFGSMSDRSRDFEAATEEGSFDAKAYPVTISQRSGMDRSLG